MSISSLVKIVNPLTIQTTLIKIRHFTLYLINRLNATKCGYFKGLLKRDERMLKLNQSIHET